ncbi:MAG TPA: nucleotide synthetase [Allosphingosinicella sp.]|jgi:hypothetical protein|nr:nucleotide synthetase [Allosphingosinicella sp.]
MTLCDMTKFPDDKYFKQYEIPQSGPNGDDYDYTRLLLLKAGATTDINGPDPRSVLDLSFELEELKEDGGRPGIEHFGDQTWEKLAESLFNPELIRVGGPFDFTLWNKSRVVIMLKGEFWELSQNLSPFTTKQDYGGHYSDLRRHVLDDDGVFQSLTEQEWEKDWKGTPCNCFSFYSGDPCLPSWKTFHGFSLNVDLIMWTQSSSGPPVKKTLPITVDPDIENKGGNPGP